MVPACFPEPVVDDAVAADGGGGGTERSQEAAHLEFLLAAARRTKEQVDAALVELDQKARHLLAAAVGFVGLAATSSVWLATLLSMGTQPASKAAFGLLLFAVPPVAAFMSAAAAVLMSYSPRPYYLDVAPALCQRLLRENVGPVEARANILASTLHSAEAAFALLGTKSRALRWGSRALLVGVVASSGLLASVVHGILIAGGRL